MTRWGANVARTVAAAAMLSACSGADASTPGTRDRPRDDGVEIGTALTCDTTTCEERSEDGTLVRSYPTPTRTSGD